VGTVMGIVDLEKEVVVVMVALFSAFAFIFSLFFA
jgi:hypothetical protein